MAASRPKISLCMIVRNEQEGLAECLGCVADLVQEMVVVDTGSTDETRAVAERCGARVHEFAWVDSFSAARNESLRHATGDWIFWMDADDRLDGPNRRSLKALLARLSDQKAAYLMKCISPASGAEAPPTIADTVRLFPNHPAIHFQYRVHEQVTPALRRLGIKLQFSDVVIHHTGYLDPVQYARKRRRNLRLLELDYQDHPDDPFILFYLGQTYVIESGRPADAVPLLQRSLALMPRGQALVLGPKLYLLLVRAYEQLGKPDEALKTCCDGRADYRNESDLLFCEGVLRQQQGDLAGAEACLLQLLEKRSASPISGVVAGVHGFNARHNLAIVYFKQGRLAEAEAQWRAALAERPDFTPARQALLQLAQKSS